MSRFLTAQYVGWRAFPLVAFASLVLLRGRLRPFGAVLSILAYCTLLHAITHAEARLSEPLHPLLLVIAAAALVSAVERSSRRTVYGPRRPSAATGSST